MRYWRLDKSGGAGEPPPALPAECSRRGADISSEKGSRFVVAPRWPLPRFSFEWLLVAGVVLSGAVLVAYASRDMWFYSDMWDFMALRRITDLESIVRPHFGHWQIPAAIQTRALYAIAGMDFWPVHYLPRAFWWAAFSVFSWWVMRRRGAHPVAALGTLAVITVLATSFYFQAAHVGALIATASALGVAMLVEAREHPKNRDRLLVFLMLQLGVMSAGVGVSSLLGLSLGLLIVRRFRRWAVPVVSVGAIYAWWFIAFDVANEDAAGAVRALVEVPWAVVVNVKNVLLAVTGLPSMSGWPFLVAAVAGLAWLAWKRRLSVFGMLMLSAAFVYLVLVSRSRPSLDRAAVATNVTLMLTPVFVPYLSRLKRSTVYATGVVLAALVVSHGLRLESGLDERIAMINEGRPTIESMATLIARGDSYRPGLRFTDLSSSSQLTLSGVARLVDEGWSPGVSTAESAAVVRLRVSYLGTAAEGDAAIDLVAGRLRLDGCVVALDGRPIVLDVTGSADLTIRVTPPTRLAVGWSGSGSSGSTTLMPVRWMDRDLYVFGPPDGGTITLTPVDPVLRMIVCGVARYVDS